MPKLPRRKNEALLSLSRPVFQFSPARISRKGWISTASSRVCFIHFLTDKPINTKISNAVSMLVSSSACIDEFNYRA